jgi:dTDP-4-dehydrorhamnose 3,5-epimerase
MKIELTPFQGLFVATRKRFSDDRGYFMELYRESYLKEFVPISFRQDNLSYSSHGVLRGLHFQVPPYAQAKLVSVLLGEVLDVVVDLRFNSKTFGKWYSIVLSDENSKMMYVPEGFAHGFVVRSQDCLFHYKCSSEYMQSAEQGLCWCDPTLNINWGVESPIVSEKDKALPFFDAELFKNLFV